jgi:UDP-glucose 4-epimerase
MDCSRANEVLGWKPKISSLDALTELLRGLRHGDGLQTPPLDPHAGGPGRIGELLTGVGQRR